MSHAVSVPPPGGLYDEDVALWAEEQATLLEKRRFAQLDLVNLIDEVRSVGASQKSEIRNRLKVLIAHLLEWRYQPGRRGSSWRATIDHQRDALRGLINISPSLKRYPAEILDGAFLAARLQASRETGIDFTLFPKNLPFSIEQILDDDYFPPEPDLEEPNP